MASRWLAIVYHREDEDSSIGVPYEIEEVGEIQHVVEHGPNWNTIDRIEIRLLREIGPRMTLNSSSDAGDTQADDILLKGLEP